MVNSTDSIPDDSRIPRLEGVGSSSSINASADTLYMSYPTATVASVLSEPDSMRVSSMEMPVFMPMNAVSKGVYFKVPDTSVASSSRSPFFTSEDYIMRTVRCSTFFSPMEG